VDHVEKGSVRMTYVIGEACIDVLDRTCIEECPVDCIYEGERMLYIHPDECVDCGACEPVCPVEAIYYEDDLPDEWKAYTADNARFFTETLPGRSEPLGSPGGAAKVGVVGVDTPMVAGVPLRQ
jgi:NAD-dependent dihydropyrimidine dehydrogenase PreA subunit